MSANLLDGITPTLVSGASSSDDVISIAANAGGERNVVKYAISGLEVLSANQTMHIGISLRAESGGDEWTSAVVVYRDSANNFKARSNSVSSTGDGAWHRHSMGVTVPSGMTIVGINFNQKASGTAIDFANPVFSYGSTGIVMAAGSITIASITDVASTTRWYMLQSSTLTAPTAPTASPPGGSWATTEPTYTEGSTNSLYFVDETIFSDGTWAYSDVSLSTSYEAAKAAYNKAAAASAAAAATDQHFWADTDGAHVSSTGDHDTSGFHQLMTSVKNAFMHGTTELMTISENLIELGKNSSTAIIKFCAGNGSIGITSSKQLYLSGTDGAYLARQTDIDNGNDSGIGLVDDNGSSLAVLHANRFSLGGPTISSGRFYTAIVPAVLYNGGAALDYDTAPGAGTTGTVTLSETAANFSKLKIFFRTDDNAYGSCEVPFPNGKRVGLSSNWSTGTSMWYKARAIDISGTSITTVEYGSVNSDGSSFSHINVIYIVRVEGIR